MILFFFKLILNGTNYEDLPSCIWIDWSSSKLIDLGQNLLQQAIHTTEQQIQTMKIITKEIMVLF